MLMRNSDIPKEETGLQCCNSTSCMPLKIAQKNLLKIYLDLDQLKRPLKSDYNVQVEWKLHSYEINLDLVHWESHREQSEKSPVSLASVILRP